MKKLLVVATLLLLLTGCSSGDGWTLYTNKQYNVAFYYPDTWQIEDSQKVQMTQKPVVLILDTAKNEDNSTAGITFTAEQAPLLAQPAEEQVNSLVKQFELSEAAMGIKDFKKISYEPVKKYKDLQAGIMTYQYTIAQSNQIVKAMLLVVPRGKVTYGLTLTSTPNQWDTYKPTFDKIAASFDLQ
ncbi:MAG: PsbP-related protein [Carboxydocellales bacterium]